MQSALSRILVLTVVLGGAAAYLLRDELWPAGAVQVAPESGEAAAPAPPVSAAGNAPQEAQLPVMAATPESPGSDPARREGNPYARPPEGNQVEFRVEGGLAIAYGDVLLGRPEAGFQGDRGHTEVPTPQLWDRGILPYLISPLIPDPRRIERAIEYLKKNTPVKPVPYSGERDGIVFEPADENCLSGLGRRGGLQSIRVSPGCGTQEILHEIMHALGFVHEQSRPDRDRHIEVLWENIEPRFRSQFAIVPDTFMEAMRGSTFDTRSIMIYRTDTFALRQGLRTMRPLGESPISPTPEGLSSEDIRRLRRLYDPYER